MLRQTGNLLKVQNECNRYWKKPFVVANRILDTILARASRCPSFTMHKKGFRCENVRLPFQVLNFMSYKHFSFFD